MFVVVTKHGTRFVEDMNSKDNTVKIYIVKEQPFSIEKTELPSPRKLLKHFMEGGK